MRIERAGLAAWLMALNTGLIACSSETSSPADGSPDVQELRTEIFARYPHDPSSFTEGLAWTDDGLIESLGLTGESSVRKVDLRSGQPQRSRSLPDDVFGEGVAVVGAELYQLSWHGGRGFIWDAERLELVRTFSYSGEGWGLCFDGSMLVMSDGSDMLYFREPETFQVERTIHVTLSGKPLYRINELECAEGRIYANVWRTGFIARIDPNTGQVDARIRATDLLSQGEADQADVLNGIAYIASTGHFLVTGKLWPWVFEVTWAMREPRGPSALAAALIH
jgi:glutamine cyclotransferase